MLNIPDKLYKLLILVGLVLVGFSWTKSNDSYKDYAKKYDRYDNLFDSLKLLEEEILFEQENFKEECSEFDQKYKSDSTYYEKGNNIFFNKPLLNDPNIKSAVQLLESKWSKILELKHKEELLNIKLENYSEDHTQAKKDLRDIQEEFNFIINIGAFLIGLGITMWFIDETDKPKEKIKQFDKIYQSCQSCGNNFNALRNYGKNLDGTFNLGLCSECYENGVLKEVDLTQEIVFNRYCQKHNITRRLRKYFIRKFINKLDRWKN